MTDTSRHERRPWILNGSDLSPFAQKVELLCKRIGLPLRKLPDEGSLIENLRMVTRTEALKHGLLPLTWPKKTNLDEFPLVPYLLGPDGENLYDSTSIAQWFDQHPTLKPPTPFVPKEDSAVAFAIQLIDEYADEFVLYMLHHFRWKVSSHNNDPGARLTHEMRTFLGPLQRLAAHRWFNPRQVRRLMYLFSVAPKGFGQKGIAKDRTAPSRPGFPPTHALLEDAFARLLDILDGIFAKRPYLFGDAFTLADASLFGHLATALEDPASQDFIARRAPHVLAWTEKHLTQTPFAATIAAPARLFEDLQPLLNEIRRTYVPLMEQNEAAYEQHKAAGETLFNERAFWKGRALYDGIIDGHPFRSVVKTFQVKTWRTVKDAWRALDETERARLGDTHLSRAA